MGVLSSIIDRSISGSFSSNAIRVGTYSFQDCTGLSSVSFPNAVHVGGYAFYACTGLSSASFPDVMKIYTCAFEDCSSLTTVYIGTGISSVCTLADSTAFRNCSNLTNIYVPSSLVDKYKSDTNWSNYADKIKAAP